MTEKQNLRMLPINGFKAFGKITFKIRGIDVMLCYFRHLEIFELSKNPSYQNPFSNVPPHIVKPNKLDNLLLSWIESADTADVTLALRPILFKEHEEVYRIITVGLKRTPVCFYLMPFLDNYDNLDLYYIEDKQFIQFVRRYNIYSYSNEITESDSIFGCYPADQMDIYRDCLEKVDNRVEII